MIKTHFNRAYCDILSLKGHYEIRRNAINEWYHEITVSMKVEHIDRICEVLNCSVGELIEYIPNEKPKTGKHLIIEEHGNRKPKREGCDE